MGTKNKELTQEFVKDVFKYNPVTGVLKWRKPTSSKVKIGDIIKSPNGSGYYRVGLLGKRYRVHRVIWLYMTGGWPKGVIDHINRVRNDNRWCNLRDVSRSCNSKNTGILSNNKSGVTGVVYIDKSNSWQVELKDNKEKVNYGRYKDKDSAITIKYLAEIRHGFCDCKGQTDAYNYLKINNILPDVFCGSGFDMIRVNDLIENLYSRRLQKTKYNLTLSGRTMTIAEWSKELGISKGVLSDRVRRGWPDEKVLTKQSKRLLQYKDRVYKIDELIKLSTISKKNFQGRLDQGWSVERALTTPVIKKNKKEK